MNIKKYTKDITGVGFGFLKFEPTNLGVNEKLPIIYILHGTGGQASGTIAGTSAGLDALAVEIPQNFKNAVDNKRFIGIAPQTSYSWNMGEVNTVASYVDKNILYDINHRYGTGYSLGAGGIIYFAKLSLENAKYFHAIAPIATTRQYSGTVKNIVDAKLPVWFFHNLLDNNSGTPVSATNEVYDDILTYSPTIKPTKTLFNKSGHGGWGEAYDSVNPPIAPGGQGLTNVAITLYDWFFMNSEITRMTVPSPAPPSTTLTAVAGVRNIDGSLSIGTINVSNAIIKLDGTTSQNYKAGNWKVTKVPDGVNIYSVNGPGYITGSITLPKIGSYTFLLTTFDGYYTGNIKTSEIIVNYSDGTIPPEPVKTLIEKVFIPKNNNYVYVYDDGSTETKAS